MNSYGNRTRKNEAIFAALLFATVSWTGVFGAETFDAGPSHLNSLVGPSLVGSEHSESHVAGAEMRGTRADRSGTFRPADSSFPDRDTCVVFLVAEAEEETEDASLLAALPSAASSSVASRMPLSSTCAGEADWSQFQRRVSLARGPPLA